MLKTKERALFPEPGSDILARMEVPPGKEGAGEEQIVTRARLLDLGTVDPLTSQAVYHGLAEAMDPEGPPALILVRPNAPYICIGAHQELAKEVDTAYCEQADLPVYRRHVGGGAVLLDGDQLFFQFVVPSRRLPERQVERLFPHFIAPVVDTYRSLGVEAEFRPINDIQVGRRKIGGTGAAAIGEATVMVGSFMFRFDSTTMARALRVGSEKFRDKLQATLEEYVTSMERQLKELPSPGLLRERFADALGRRFGWDLTPDDLTGRERAAIRRAEEDLADPEWLHQKGRQLVPGGVKIQADTHLTDSCHKAAGGLIRATLLEQDARVGELLLSGDVLSIPESGLDDIAADLADTVLDPEAVARRVAESFQRRGLEIPGVTPSDIAAAVLAARPNP